MNPQPQPLTKSDLYNKEIKPETTTKDGAKRISDAVKRIVAEADDVCDVLRTAVREFGFDAVAAEFGDKGPQELISLYHRLRMLVKEVGGCDMPNMRTREEIDAWNAAKAKA